MTGTKCMTVPRRLVIDSGCKDKDNVISIIFALNLGMRASTDPRFFAGDGGSRYRDVRFGPIRSPLAAAVQLSRGLLLEILRKRPHLSGVEL